jgi:uncharacterized coiled-coil protein SlyX
MAGMRARLTAVEGQGREQRVMIENLSAAVAGLKADMDRRFDILDAKMSKQFMWLVGMHTMTLIAVVAALAAMLSAI